MCCSLPFWLTTSIASKGLLTRESHPLSLLCSWFDATWTWTRIRKQHCSQHVSMAGFSNVSQSCRDAALHTVTPASRKDLREFSCNWTSTSGVYGRDGLELKPCFKQRIYLRQTRKLIPPAADNRISVPLHCFFPLLQGPFAAKALSQGDSGKSKHEIHQAPHLG